MEHGDIFEAEASDRFFGDFAHHFLGHRWVRLVVEEIDAAPKVVVAHDAEEDVDRARARAGHRSDRFGGVEALRGYTNQHWLASGNRWDQGKG